MSHERVGENGHSTLKMKSFHNRVVEHDNPDGAESWSRWIKYKLMSNEKIKLGDLSEKMYGRASEIALVKTRRLMSVLRKPLERRTNRLLMCHRGEWELLSPRDSHAENTERLKRKDRVVCSGTGTSLNGSFGSYKRAVDISLQHNPTAIFSIKRELNMLVAYVSNAEGVVLKQLEDASAKKKGGLLNHGTTKTRKS